MSWLTSVMKVSTTGSAGWLGVDGGEVGLRQHLAHDPPRGAGVDQIVDDQPALPVAGYAA